MKNLAILILVIIVFAAGAWYWNAHRQPASQQSTDLGSYPYDCDDGSMFTLSPAGDLKTVQVSADAQGMFTGTATLSQTGATSYAGTAPDGQSVTLMGDGETVHLTVSSEQATCNPKPNEEAAPWNWGDAGAQ